MNENTIPEGYKVNARGDLIAIANIKAIDQAKDDLVYEIVKKAKDKAAELVEFKTKTMADIEAFVQLSNEQYGVKLGGIKGNVSLVSFDGKYRVLRSIQETLAFDEKIQAARKLIDDCLHSWTEGARPELCTLINNAFAVDSAGNLSIGRILSLRQLDIKDERWQQAMRAISDSVVFQCSKAFIRVYEKSETGEEKLINLDVAKV